MEKNYKTKKEEMKKEKTAGNAVVFENPEFGKVLTQTDENGEPLFCAKDVCDILGYKKSYNAVYQFVNPHDTLKQGAWVVTGIKKDGSEAKRWSQVLFVNESGFYALVLGSKLPTAVKFKNWVTSEVLPQIRIAKNGENIIQLENQVDHLLPKALYTDNVLNSVSCYTTTQIAKELGITAQELNRQLCALHIQYYQSGQYLLYADYAHMGLAKSRTRYSTLPDPHCDGAQEKLGTAYTHTYLVWTERGRKFIHLKVKG